MWLLWNGWDRTPVVIRTLISDLSCVISPRLTTAESPLRFLCEAPKIYEMCLHVLLSKRGCGGGIANSERLEEPTRSFSDKVRFNNVSRFWFTGELFSAECSRLFVAVESVRFGSFASFFKLNLRSGSKAGPLGRSCPPLASPVCW